MIDTFITERRYTNHIGKLLVTSDNIGKLDLQEINRDYIEHSDFSSLVGQKIVAIHGVEQYSQNVIIRTENDIYLMGNVPDCCEMVTLEDFEGDIADFIGETITLAEIRDSGNEPLKESWHEWTFYELQTSKGSLWLRWLGDSENYSTNCSLYKLINYTLK